MKYTPRHPAFEQLIDTRRAEGITVQLVQYRQDHPDYEGGRYVEVYAGPGYLPDGRSLGECLDPDFGPEGDLDSCLDDAINCFPEER